ncbi:STAS domain-containing protein [Pannus brasiliensis CCIBt3594]|uniref:Anti-sigma factor antagonist n=1 Tax=Pannus brasiliensis CCIBt3594 TaxID=1427578 RepID=A0AAW9QP60_9CHRO
MLDSRLALFEPAGYITAANSLDFQEQLTELVNKGEHSIFLVDMSAVEFLDSAGLMVLVTAFRLAGNLGKSFNICSIPPSVKIIFELTQLDRVLSIYRDREEFEASLQPSLAA